MGAMDESGERVIKLFKNETQATQWVKYYRSNIDIDIRPIERKLEVLAMNIFVSENVFHMK